MNSKSRHAKSHSTHSRGYEEPPGHGHSSRPRLVTGRLIGHRDGYGFVVPDREFEGIDRDIFIRPDGLGAAMHGDRVQVQVIRSRRPSRFPDEERLEGLVVKVLDRAQKTVVGEFHFGSRFSTVRPFDQHIAQEIVIPRGQEIPRDEAAASSRQGQRQFGGESEGQSKARERHSTAASFDGMIVDVEITSFPQGNTPARGRVIEVLGQRGDFGVDVEMIIRKFHLPHRFPPEALAEAAASPQFISERMRQGRRDFRDFPIVTIDGETAKDFDDAVYVERRHNHFILHVHIADVAHYVRQSTALDREARLRGTSVYFPDRAVPMLPLELSNGICSLNPHVERLVMSVVMELDSKGRVLEAELAPGIIRSAERMTYTAVQSALDGDAAAVARYAHLLDQFRLMEELAKLLNHGREERGAIDFDLPEPEIEFDESGRMIGVARSERTMAHRIIEEFMLAANEAVAGFLEARAVPSLYRIHEKPDPKKVIEFEEIAAPFGYSLGVELPAAWRVRVHARDERDRYPRFQEKVDGAGLKITSRHYQRLTQRIAGKPEERILSYLMLRSLKQARYSEENQGHFALASQSYTHFTSPIRRYPDLIVHRILKAVLEGEGGSARHRFTEHPAREPHSNAHFHPELVGHIPIGELRSLSLETSEAERRAADAERDLLDLKKVAFMAERLGDEFEALIISLTKHGFFVELVDIFVEGFVPLEQMGGGRYIYREKLRAIVSRDSKKAFRLGERIQVRLDRIDHSGNKLEFAVIESS
ncbi:MAG TPA: VacB/RNase II family 3'-5' exoribonuclease [Terriglobia bacterium]|nr:VacB/RNase II family 3'-5' exoribonuclease [Terriglobia bacterium]